jgi:hypothetical protein
VGPDVRRVVGQIGEFVQNHVRREVVDGPHQGVPVEDVAENRFGAEVPQEVEFAG